MRKVILRNRVSDLPKGVHKLGWYGPGLLWMLSAVGTGSILFTPRVASVYRYELVWLLLLVVFFMWVMIREMARFSIVTGRTMLEGMHTLAGPPDWAVWIIFVPQLAAAAVGIAGLSAILGGAISIFLPGNSTLHALLVLTACTALTSSGRYAVIEGISRMMAIVLLIMVVVSAAVVFPTSSDVASGLLPGWPESANWYVILPWVGTILAGSMGIVWFGYWTATRGYGGGLAGRERDEEAVERGNKSDAGSQSRQTRIRRAAAWIPIGSGAAAVGCLGGLTVLLAFMVLGAELLAPKGILPQGTDVAIDLTVMFSGIWGEPGEWLLLAIIFIALTGSIIANQDGWGRSFADMTLILTRALRKKESSPWLINRIRRLEKGHKVKLLTRVSLKRFYILSITGLLPLLIVLLFPDPVMVMSASGIIAAAHTPFIVMTALFVNRTRLPAPLRPSLFYTGAMAAAGVFYAVFALAYVADFLGWL